VAKQEYGDDYHQFLHADINDVNIEICDVIIAFEVLEHLDNGREIAQELKKHCKCLLTTVPFMEPVGLWGPHHKLHGLSQEDFPGFEYKFMNEKGEITDRKQQGEINLLLMKWEEDKFKKHVDVTAVISTKDRYYTTLPLTLSAIINQTYKPVKIIIFDDGEHKDLREDSIYQCLFNNMYANGINWEVVFGERKGQVLNHQKSIYISKTEWIWRIDDDEIPEPNVLENLVNTIDEKTGAVAGLVLDPNMLSHYNSDRYNKIEDIQSSPNCQWFFHKTKSIISVDHLYSSFLYRKSASQHGYCLDLSTVGHREETLFTYEMKRNGWDLLVNPNVITWHYRSPNGGIRSYNDEKLWKHDEEIFQEKLLNWEKYNTGKIIILNNGLGDHIAFAMVLPQILEKYPDLTLAVCYTEPFEDFDVKLISIAEAQSICNPSKMQEDDIYKWMEENNWNCHITEAYRRKYL
jgi:GT2 family glycosyltransferase